MDWITSSSLASVGGAALAVTLVTAILKQVFGIMGKRTQVVALCLSVIIAVIIGDVSSAAGAFVTLLNGFVICAAALGIDQAANYGK